MATKIVFVLIVSYVLLRVSHSLPVSLDVKTVQSTYSVAESGLTKRTTVFDSETVKLEEDSKLTQSLNTEMLLKSFGSFEAERRVRRVSRTKRHITKAKKLCPADMIEYAGQCLTKEKYEENYDY